MNAETGFGVVEYNVRGGAGKYGIPPAKMPVA
jgi:hypothetical protein